MPITNAQLAQEINDLITYYNVREDQVDAWIAGVYNGGVGSVGVYPLTTLDGTVYNRKSPERLEYEVDILVTSADASATAAAIAETNAETAETNAETAATSALGYRDTANTHKIAAAASASAAANSAASALANQVLTAADVIAAEADRVAAAASAVAADVSADAAAASAIAAALFDPANLDTLTWTGSVERVTTGQYGAFIHGDAADTITYLQLLNNADSPLANFAANPTDTYLYSYTHGVPVRLYAEDAGGTSRLVFAGDPDDAATLYYAGTSKAETTAYGLYVGTGSNLSPNSSGDGYLKLRGSGYIGYITMDGSAMYIGHNSGTRSLAFQVDEASSFVVNAEYSQLISTTDSSPYLSFHGSNLARDMYLQSSSDTAYYWYGENHGAAFYIRGEDAGGTARDILYGDPDGYTEIHAAGYLGIRVGNATLGFYNSSGSTKQTVTGSRGGNAALASLLSSLANIGLITDSSTA